MTVYTPYIKEFVDREFERLDREAGRRKTWFTFSIIHVIRGTTSVWGRSSKDNIPRRLINIFSDTLNELIEGKEVLEGYRFEAVIRSRVRSYKVIRVDMMEVPVIPAVSVYEAENQMSNVQACDCV